MIVSRNCAVALRRCLRALEASLHREQIETLVVDCGSRDGCESIDAEFPWVTALRMPRNFGRTRARNIAMRTAGGQLVLFLSPAVEVEPATVAALAKRLEADRDAYAVIPALRDPRGEPVATACKLPSRDDLLAACKEHRELPAALPGERVQAARDLAWMVRRQFIAGLSFLEEKRYSEFWADLEVFDQIRSVGKQIVVEPGAPAVFHAPPDEPLGPGDRAMVASDRTCGAAAYLGKRAGFGALLGFRLAMVLHSLGAMVSFREPGFHLRLLVNLLGGARIDGTQGGDLA